jgi:hypothetical protein
LLLNNLGLSFLFLGARSERLVACSGGHGVHYESCGSSASARRNTAERCRNKMSIEIIKKHAEDVKFSGKGDMCIENQSVTSIPQKGRNRS